MAGDKQVWVYRSKKGAELYRAVRLDVDGKKRYWQETSVGGVWKQEAPPEDLSELYQADLLARAIKEGDTRAVFFVEGEKCADAVTALTTPAKVVLGTCIAGGSNAPLLEGYLNDLLRFDSIYILPDNDPPGLLFAGRVYAELLRRRSDQTVDILCLPYVGRKGDIADFLALYPEEDRIKALAAVVKSNSPSELPHCPFGEPQSDRQEQADQLEPRIALAAAYDAWIRENRSVEEVGSWFYQMVRLHLDYESRWVEV